MIIIDFDADQRSGAQWTTPVLLVMHFMIIYNFKR